jgi:hypothetical protein
MKKSPVAAATGAEAEIDPENIADNRAERQGNSPHPGSDGPLGNCPENLLRAGSLALLTAERSHNIRLGGPEQISRARELLEAAGLGYLRPSGSWRPRTWADRLAALPVPEEELVRRLAKAIYNTHSERKLVGPHGRAPIWENASDSVKEWVEEQARAALVYLRSLERGSK